MIKLKKYTNRVSEFWRARLGFVPDQNAEEDRERRWADWIKRIATGDTEALAALYDESSPIIFSLVLKILGDRECAEDALVAIYDHARRRAASFNTHWQGPLVWLITMARDNPTARRRTAVPAQDRQHDLFPYKRTRANLAVAKLSDEERSIIEMTYMGGLSAVEVAGLWM